MSEDCFKNTTSAGGAQGAGTPQRNLLFANRFRILKQKIFAPKGDMTNEAANSFNTQATATPFSWFIPLGGLRINFNAGTTASIANVIDNSIHVIAFASSASLTPRITYNARLRFVG